MEPTTQAAVPTAPVAPAKPERKQIAKRDWLNPDGSVADKEETAVAARYTYLADGKSHTFEPITTDFATRMCAIFGALTLKGNIVNTWIGEKGDKADSPIDDIAARFELLTADRRGETPAWIDRTGGVGVRVDKDALVAAYVTYAASQGQTRDPADVMRKILEKPSRVADMRAIPEVLAEYKRLVGAKIKPVADVLSDI